MRQDEAEENKPPEKPRTDRPPGSAARSEPKGVTEVWVTGRLKQAEKLLERFAKEFDECEPQDPGLLRDYYRWTGKPHYRTEFGWRAGQPEKRGEDPADVIERVNC